MCETFALAGLLGCAAGGVYAAVPFILSSHLSAISDAQLAYRAALLSAVGLDGDALAATVAAELCALWSVVVLVGVIVGGLRMLFRDRPLSRAIAAAAVASGLWLALSAPAMELVERSRTVLGLVSVVVGPVAAAGFVWWGSGKGWLTGGVAGTVAIATLAGPVALATYVERDLFTVAAVCAAVILAQRLRQPGSAKRGRDAAR
jgi:hypothetical protein